MLGNRGAGWDGKRRKGRRMKRRKSIRGRRRRRFNWFVTRAVIRRLSTKVILRCHNKSSSSANRTNSSKFLLCRDDYSSSDEYVVSI